MPTDRSHFALLSVAQMAAADRAAIAGGRAGVELMERAGAAVASAVLERYPRGDIVVLCGPGNNGGDGFVAARLLARKGRHVRVAATGPLASYKGDAFFMAESWNGKIAGLGPEALDGAAVVVDAIFGAGLSRATDGKIAETIRALNAHAAAVVAVDMPSGISGDSGEALGEAVEADVTMTFFRKKPGHLLLPGRSRCGEVVLADIGIPSSVLPSLDVKGFENDPALWQGAWPTRRLDDHKYKRGHAVIVGGGRETTGAGRLTAKAALRIGAGLSTLLCPEDALAINASALDAVMVRAFADEASFEAQLADTRRNAILLGPGSGVGMPTRDRVLRALATRRAVVLDADALSSFADDPQALFRRIKAPTVLTPHEGEYARLFDGGGDKLARARKAAAKSGAVVLLKGADTVVAAPDGLAAINAKAPPTLATAGAGDVLAGLIVGLLAQGMPAFEAAAAAVWIHGAAAEAFGPGLTADDLGGAVPGVLAELER
jgi:NAD(P)H-hydrate epimerase